MKKYWRFGALVFVLAICLFLVGACSNEDELSNAGDASDETPLSVVKLGFLGPITGLDSAEGEAARNAFMLAIEEANQSGRFPYTIDVIYADDKGEADVAIAAAKRIVSDEAVLAVAGFLNNGPAEATLNIFQEASLPLVIWGAGANDLTSEETMPYIMRLVPNDKQQVAALARVVLDQQAQGDWFVITAEETAETDAFVGELSQRGLSPRGLVALTSDNLQLEALCEQIIASGAQAVYCSAGVEVAAQLKQALYEGGLKEILYCILPRGQEEHYLHIDRVAGAGTLAVRPGAPLEESESGRSFLQRYQDQGYAVPAAVYTAYAYEAAWVILNALEACGASPTAAALAEQLAQTASNGIIGMTSFDSTGQTMNDAAYLTIMRQGAWAIYE